MISFIFILLSLANPSPEDNLQERLIKHVKDGDHARVVELLEQGAHIDGIYRSYSPIMWAFKEAQPEMVTLLLERGADVNKENKHGRAPIHFAAASEYPDLVELLLQKGADANHRTKKKLTPLMMAALRGRSDCFETLLNHGARIKDKDKDKQTLMHYAARGANKHILGRVQALGLPLNKADKWGFTPLMVGVGEREVIEFFASQNVKITKKTRLGDSLLHLAAQKGSVESIEWLVQNGLEVNARGRALTTPLMAAVLGTHDQAVRALVNLGADPSIKDKYQDSPLAYVHFLRNNAMYQVICENGWDGASFHCAVRAGDLEGTRRELEKKVDINVENPMGETPVFLAAKEGWADVIALLLREGGNPDTPTRYGWSPLYVASNKGHHEVVSLLLEHGVKMDIPIPGGDTPLGAALENNHTDIAEILLSAGAQYLYFLPEKKQARQFSNTTLEKLSRMRYEGLKAGHFQQAFTPFWLIDYSVDSVKVPTDPGVIKPEFTHKVHPVYPSEGFQDKVTGYVILGCILGADGYIRELQVLRSLGNWRYGFEFEAIKAVRQWRYKPGLFNGQPTDVKMTLKIEFRI